MRETVSQTAIQPGWDVYTRDEEHVGSIAEVGNNYLLVEKGLLFPKDIYVPLSAVTRASDERVILNITKPQVDSQAWDQPPSGDAYGTGSTMGSTGSTMGSTASTIGSTRTTTGSTDASTTASDAYVNRDDDR